MKVRKLIDFHDFIPPYGVNSVEVSDDGSVLTCRIFYDAEGDQPEQCASLVFRHTLAFIREPCPGCGLLDKSQFALDSMDNLIELMDSDILIKMRKFSAESDPDFDWLYKNIRHFHMYFHSENITFDIWADEFELSLE